MAYLSPFDYGFGPAPSTTSTTTELDAKLCSPSEKGSWPWWWYFLLLPSVPTLPMVLYICIFYNRQSWKWRAPSPEEYLSYDTCNVQDGSALERWFTIDIIYGNYGFATVKAIDLAWDVIIAQAGRAFHVYILFHHVARNLLTCFMEYSSLTYEDYISIIFSRSWFGSLKFFLGRFSRDNKIPVSMAIFGVAYMIVYTFSFSAVWSAATGYISPSQRAYQMPDNTYVPLNSPHLALCWKIDSGRLGLEPGHVELGPDFSTLEPWLYKSSKEGRWSELEVLENSNSETPKYGQFHQNRMKRSTSTVQDGYEPINPDANDDKTAFRGWYRTIWDNIGPAGMGLDSPQSDISKEIFSYAFTTRMFQVVFNATGLNITGYDTPINLNATGATAAVDLTEDHYRVVDVTREHQLPKSMQFDQFHYVDWANHSQDDVGDMKIFNTWPMYAIPDSYVINDTINPGEGVIPYNSTFSFNGTRYPLEAPFLDIGYGCSHSYNYFTALGNCVCYNGEPITYAWYSDDNVVCLDSPRYVWGFSSFILFIAAILELVWVVFAIMIRGYCQWWSQLMKYPRVKGAGLVWAVLEISEAMKRDLGDEDGMARERIMRRKLSSRDRIGYAADVDEHGILQRVLIVSRSQRTITSISRHNKEIMLERGQG